MATAAALACSALLAGCGGSPEASPAPIPSPSPSESSASPTEAPPEMPDAAKQRSEAGAEKAVAWFLEAMDYAGQTGKTAPFEASFTSDCARCAAIADGIKGTYADGGSIEGGAWTAQSFKSYGIDQGVAYIDAVIDYAPQTLTPSADASPQEAGGASNVLHAFQLQWSKGAWRVGALDPEA